ncbi:MAG: hypothetical protein AAGD10_07415 [Myxococcota bacterium]
MTKVRRPLLGLCLVAMACEAEPVTSAPGVELQFEPSELRLGVVAAGFELSEPLRLGLEGGRSLRILEVEGTDEQLQLVERSDGFSLPGRQLEPREALDVRLVWVPDQSGPIQRRLRVVGDTGDASLTVTGEVVEVRSVDLRPTPERPDFGSRFVGERVERALVLINDARVAARFERADEDPSLEAVPAAFDLAPGGAIGVDLIWSPQAPGPSPEPRWSVNGRSELSVRTLGEAIAPGTLRCDPQLDLGEAPRGELRSGEVACQADGPILVSEVRLLGSPDFEVRRDVRLERGLDLEIGFEPTGLAGAQLGRVQVSTVEGQQVEVELTARTLGPEGPTLRVGSSWDTAEVDLDLHLTRGSADPFVSGEDCHFQDKNPDWGLEGPWVDDPFLDRDALVGPGPEIINLESPVETRYEVWVHAFGFEGMSFPRTEATVLIELDGRDFTADTRFDACGVMWRVGALTREGLVWTWNPLDERRDFAPFADERCR